jgi:hypothetical protein
MQLSLDISATPLELVHYAGDPSDCSHGIRLLTPSCSYTGGWCMWMVEGLPMHAGVPAVVVRIGLTCS